MNKSKVHIRKMNKSFLYNIPSYYTRFLTIIDRKNYLLSTNDNLFLFIIYITKILIF